ncbi:hypothetical protein MK139_17565 [bacterium]|nr:hypothetical protein [bacterium]
MGTSDPKTVSLASAIRGRVRRMVASSEQLSLAYLRLARSMSTRGFNPPLSGSWEEQEQRWRNQGKPGSSDSPSTYIDFGVEDSNLFSEVLSFLPSDARILEIGCNAGRNLDYLFRAGYTNLWGIEIGSAAVEMFGATFPRDAREHSADLRGCAGRDYEPALIALRSRLHARCAGKHTP